MSDSPQESEDFERERTRRLYATDDARVWAEEFVATAKKLYFIEGRTPDNFKGALDEGWMIGWFANAMETAKNLYKQRSIVTVHRNEDETIEFETDPLPLEVLISTQLLEEMINRHNECMRSHIRLMP